MGGRGKGASDGFLRIASAMLKARAAAGIVFAWADGMPSGISDVALTPAGVIGRSPAQTALRPSDPGGRVDESAGAAEVIGERTESRHKARSLWLTPRCAL